tara:strand:- start:186 stop:431 length:246 start_codon:yes stop_codon:yes gene_type:complete
LIKTENKMEAVASKGVTMPITKKQWLDQTIMFDEWGRPPSLADVPLTYGPRKKAFKLKGYSTKEINTIWEETKNGENENNI